MKNMRIINKKSNKGFKNLKKIIKQLVVTENSVKNMDATNLDISYSVYTSGSKGIPKGITIKQKILVKISSNLQHLMLMYFPKKFSE